MSEDSYCEECGDYMEFFHKRIPVCDLCKIEARAAAHAARQARTIRRLRALADGYRARAERNGNAALVRCVECMRQGEADERARIVARLREYAETVLTDDPDYYPFKSAADIIESEEP